MCNMSFWLRCISRGGMFPVTKSLLPSLDAPKARLTPTHWSKTRSRLARKTWTERLPIPTAALLAMLDDFNALETRSDDARLINAVVGETRK